MPKPKRVSNRKRWGSSRLVSKHFRRDGKPKQALSQQKAEAEEQLTHGAMVAYKCDFCEHWHVGCAK